MKEIMEQELAQTLAALNKANSAFERIFGKQEDEDTEWDQRTELTHAQQLDKFGWCVCEGTDGQGQMAEGCPQEGECDRCEQDVPKTVKVGHQDLCHMCVQEIAPAFAIYFKEGENNE